MTSNVGIIVQARFDSSRFPGKACANIWRDESTISFLLKRLKRLNSISGQTLVLATANTQDCDVLEKIAVNLGVECFRGDKSNVFERYYQCTRHYSFDAVVRLTADCVLLPIFGAKIYKLLG